ncbi:VOC family protein [Telmatospirillum sp. J64-1]|uniref:VOC family protein n=1 Tax=Telmatospirillum sp. J64-1 TaxID=2502183 RepID=UPI00115C7830|nr:VOC family protein [Telmatospirillum sp. J64-1]
MSRFFGEIRQLGYVVNDIEQEMRRWTETLGVGPWYYAERVPVQNFYHRGQPSPIEVSVALANSGPLQVELVQQRNDAPSMYREFMERHGQGLQHVAYWTVDYDNDIARLAKQGLVPVMGGEVGAGGRYAYFDTEFHPGTVIELSEIKGPKGDLFKTIREASIGWDGKDPIRPFPKLG